MKRFAVLLGVLSLAVGSVGCSQLPDHDRYKVEISQADREKLAGGFPMGDDFMIYMRPDGIAGLSEFHGICELTEILKPSFEGSAVGQYVPLKFHCNAGNLETNLTAMIVPAWDSQDAILRLEPGQMLLVSAVKDRGHFYPSSIWEAYNLYLLADDGTLSLLDAKKTRVANLKDYAGDFGLADYKPN